MTDGWRILRAVPAVMATSFGLHATELRWDFGNLDALPYGAVAVGRAESAAGRQGGGVLLCRGAHLRLPTAAWFSRAAGSIDFRVMARWPAGDAARHTFVHLGDGDAHVTVFFHSGDRVRFAFKGNPAAWCGVDVRTGQWLPETWHHVTAAWQQTEHQGIVLCLSVDGKHGTAAGALPLPAIPQQTVVGSRGASEPADAVFDDLVLGDHFRLPALAASGDRRIEARIDTEADLGPMPRTFSFVTPWNSRSNPVPFKPGDAYFRRFREAGFEMVRLVAFSETWLWGTEVKRAADGSLALDFDDFDALLDLYRGAGAEPYVRLAYHVPKALRPPGQADNPYATPQDLQEWDRFMRRIVVHCNVERRLGIRYWVTMLNEPDIPIGKGLTDWRSVYDLYERTTRAVKAVDPTAKVGGPATCRALPGEQEEAIRNYLRFCRSHDLPPDFICFHAYRRPHPRDYETAVTAVKRVVATEWPGLRPEYMLDEWNLWSHDARQNNEYAAAYLAAAVHYQMRAGLTRSSIVSFNSHLSAEEQAVTKTEFDGPFRKGDGPGPARFYATTAELGGHPRSVLYTHAIPGRGAPPPYTFGRFGVRIPEGGCRLRVGTAQAMEHPMGDGCLLTVAVTDGGTARVVLSAHTRHPTWEEHDIDLSPFAGRVVSVEFRTNCGARGSAIADHALWGSPVLVANGRPVYDFCKHIREARTGCVLRPSSWELQQPSLPLIEGRVVKPAYFAYVLMDRLRGRRLPVTLQAGRDGIHTSDTVGVLACRDGAVVRVLIWHFDASRADIVQALRTPETTIARDVVLKLRVKPHTEWTCRQLLVDHDHTNAYTTFVRHQMPPGTQPDNLVTGAVDEVDRRRLSAPEGNLLLPIHLDNLAVTLLELSPE